MDTQRLVELHSQGLSNRAIAAELSVTHRTVAENLKKFGLTANGRTRAVRLVDGDMSLCSVCSEWKPTEEFAKARSGRSDWYYLTYCKSCRAIQQRERINSDIRVYVRDKWQRTKTRAEKLRVEFTITRDEWMAQWDAQEGLCFYTDWPMIGRVGGGTSPESASVDKVIPELGYVYGNVVFCLNRINTIKSNITLAEMEEWMPMWYERVDMWRAKGIKTLQVEPGDF